MTALSIFAVIMTISMGAILGVFNANRKSESLKTVMDNMNFALEAMAREIRFGKNYHCGTAGNILTPQDCWSGDNYFVFTTVDNHYIAYRYRTDLKQIEKSTDGNAFVAITSPEVTLSVTDPQKMFYVYGALQGDSLQPRIFMQIKGYAGTKLNTTTNFTLQTLITQRARDI